MSGEQGQIVIAGTPLGNPDDASPRLRSALESAQVVAAEDTRRARRLAAALGVTIAGELVSYYEGNERARTPRLLAAAGSGATVLLITDAGMPSVSDPGFRLVRAAVEEGISVTALPGPSAVTTALALSGLPCDRFCFEGFPPRKQGERSRYFATLATERRTMVFFESPRRVVASLAELCSALGGERPAAVCRELTKTYEQVHRGTLAELADWAADAGGVRGEITLVISGAPERVAALSVGELAAAVATYMERGLSKKEGIAAVAAETGMAKRMVYDAVIRAQDEVDSEAQIASDGAVYGEAPIE